MLEFIEEVTQAWEHHKEEAKSKPTSFTWIPDKDEDNAVHITLWHPN